ncbi:MAG: LysE family transporter [Candidatus Uhrbacteria bacterium]|nr:LysE family transporter [Patescibacteria group bacterium]MBU1907227.1 LysE family transporter [Patescibacteria group bacterium]
MSLGIIASAFVIGFTAAALPGAAQTTLFQSGLSKRVKPAVRFAIGASIMDGILLLVAALGISQLVIDHRWLVVTIGIAGTAYMGYLGIAGLVNVLSKKKSDETKPLKTNFHTGLLLVILHPPTILFFIGVAGSLFVNSNSGPLEYAFASLSVFLGALLCFLLVLMIARVAAHYGSKLAIKLFSGGASLLLIAFAIKLLVVLIKM